MPAIDEMSPDVVTVEPNDDYTLTLTFQNGEVRRFDVKPYLVHGVYERLRDIDYFKRVIPSFGTISWSNDEDFCPDTVYLRSVPVE